MYAALSQEPIYKFAVIAKISRQWCNAPTHVLDLGCGDGILGRFLLGIFPSASGLFVDFSDPMLNAARANLGAFPNTTVAKADFASSQWLEVAQPHGPFGIVVSGFAIHHQPDERKHGLYSEILDLLTPGGTFLNLEHVASATETGEELFDNFFIDVSCFCHPWHLDSGNPCRNDVVGPERTGFIAVSIRSIRDP